jgi:hypothetical protein
MRRTCWACSAPSWIWPRAPARGSLKPGEVQGRTFSITNFGSFGSVIATPIINQPQVAILGVGAVEKTPVVIDDAIAIRSVVYLSLSFDHRLIDGALADQFAAKLKQVLRGVVGRGAVEGIIGTGGPRLPTALRLHEGEMAELCRRYRNKEIVPQARLLYEV